LTVSDLDPPGRFESEMPRGRKTRSRAHLPFAKLAARHLLWLAVKQSRSIRSVLSFSGFALRPPLAGMIEIKAPLQEVDAAAPF